MRAGRLTRRWQSGQHGSLGSSRIRFRWQREQRGEEMEAIRRKTRRGSSVCKSRSPVAAEQTLSSRLLLQPSTRLFKNRSTDLRIGEEMTDGNALTREFYVYTPKYPLLAAHLLSSSTCSTLATRPRAQICGRTQAYRCVRVRIVCVWCSHVPRWSVVVVRSRKGRGDHAESCAAARWRG